MRIRALHFPLLVMLSLPLIACSIWTVPRHIDMKVSNTSTSWISHHPDSGIPYLQRANFIIHITPGEWVRPQHTRQPQAWEAQVTWLQSTTSISKPTFPITFCLERNPYYKGPWMVRFCPIEKIELVTKRKQLTARLRGIGPIKQAVCIKEKGCTPPKEITPPDVLTLTGNQERCYYADFPIETPSDGETFQLHIPNIEIDGNVVSVPALQFTLISESYRSCFLIGCFVSH